MKCARQALQKGTEADGPLICFLPLSRYKSARLDNPDSIPSPQDWLAQEWQKLAPELPPLEELLCQRRMTLLLDAFNEIPLERKKAGQLWKDFLQEFARHYPGNRVIFSCRTLDYSASLSSKDVLSVPQVRLEPLSNEQVQQFLEVYSPQHSAALWQNLKGRRQLEVLRLPYFLKLLVAQTQKGEVPAGPAALFTGFVRQALKREVEGDNPLFEAGQLLQERDIQRLTLAQRWKSPFDLPERGELIPALSQLAYQMQSQAPAGEGGQVRLNYDKALALLAPEYSKTILKAGEALGVLEEDLGRDEVLYVHQLLQEYFAARQLARAPNPELVRQAWRTDQVTPRLEETLAGLADSDPLPLLPGSGWEETTVLAAVMAPDPAPFIAALMEYHLSLAGRCGASPEIELSEALKHRLRQALLARTQDPQADLRARIAAGLTLGELGDPRLARRQGSAGEYLLPPLIAIPGGAYPIGSEKGEEGHDEDEAPRHTANLAPFWIGQFPVTNREWRLFMAAGGYEDARWWETPEAEAWRRGENTAEGPKQRLREWWAYYREDVGRIRTRLEAGRMTSQEAEVWENLVRLSETKFEAVLEEWYLPGRKTQPAFWNDEAFNQPEQPVVGISWYEANAYCAWLRAQTGQPVRLPTEAEWEAAVRGRAGRRYAYGETFKAYCGNTFETHIRRTTPIGVFPEGATPEGLLDMVGNVWEWTSSRYQPYPYQPTDGREAPQGDAPRGVRGGAWSDLLVAARAVVRGLLHPGLRDICSGFVWCVRPPSESLITEGRVSDKKKNLAWGGWKFTGFYFYSVACFAVGRLGGGEPPTSGAVPHRCGKRYRGST